MNILTFDIGGSITKYAVMDEDGHFLARGKEGTPQESREALLDLLTNIYKSSCSSDSYDSIGGITIAMPGIIDPDRGYCKMGGALRYNDDFHFRDALSKKCGVQVEIENNAKCAALAEATDGSLKDAADGLALYFDRMIGGGLIRDHNLCRGPHFAAAEVVYIVTVRNDMPEFDTVWGNRCGMPRLCAMYARAKRLPADTVIPSDVLQAAERGEPDAAACLDTFTREIAVQIFNLQTVLDVSRIAIGGEAATYPVFVEAIVTNLEEMYAVCPYDIPQAEITVCHFREDASLIGAFRQFLRRCRS